MNPYRQAFYQRQAEWHGYRDAEHVRSKHEARRPYYRWYTRDWLPAAKDTPVLDIGCGSGQFLYFLKGEGYTEATGIDIDARQVEIGRALGLDCRCLSVFDHLEAEGPRYGLIAMLDILEHFTREELFPILEAVSSRLTPGGRLIVSVPNAEGPDGLRAIYSDITHEIAFSLTSLSEMLFCHGLKVVAFRDPWPAPVSPARKAYRALTTAVRKVEGAKLRLLGYAPPGCWSSVIWAVAEKGQAG
jgi:2-polyprenyl-3-methyl-5-hydroxy-6-metoxy-1,4-benzoquinol methylase